MSIALMVYTLAWVALVASLIVWGWRTVAAERLAGNGESPGVQTRAIRRLDVALIVLLAITAISAAARMGLIMAAAH